MSYDEVTEFRLYAARAGVCMAIYADVNSILWTRRD